MILGIDAFNLRRGGGITHLVEFLRSSKPEKFGFDKVVVWGTIATLSKIDDREWLIKSPQPMLERGLFFRVFWQRFKSKGLAIKEKCDIVFVPGGANASGFSPVVTMSRNMLPFEWSEMRRYGFSMITLKLYFLRLAQTYAFNNAEGLIFLTKYAKDKIIPLLSRSSIRATTIPHGISSRFFHAPRKQVDQSYSSMEPCKILYVSIISPYKHQWEVVDACSKLRARNIPVELELIGPEDVSIQKLKNKINEVDPSGSFINYQGNVPYDKLEEYYLKSDIGVFASSCENMPNILLEGMAAGLPMACSSMGPMPEILKDAGIYFNPLDADDIANALYKLISSSSLRKKLSNIGFNYAKEYSWERCSNDTLKYLSDRANNYSR
jgi:glycosyltransferase involved in cell wall biosynthesis